MPTQLQLELQQRAADKRAAALARAEAAFARSTDILAPIPPGQPILVGHHSEKSHRSHLEKADRAMREGFRQQEIARSHSSSHAGTAILGRDPEALDALREKLQGLEATRDRKKEVNTAYRKGGWDLVRKVAPWFTEASIQNATDNMQHFSSQTAPYESWELSNLGANIRRIKKRIATLEVQRAQDDRELMFKGGRYEEDMEGDRIRLHFDRRLTKAEYSWMRQHGFRFSRANQCFQRNLNPASRWNAQKAIAEMTGVSVDLAD